MFKEIKKIPKVGQTIFMIDYDNQHILSLKKFLLKRLQFPN